MQLRDAGSWKEVRGIHLRDDGIWKPVLSAHIYRGLTPPAAGQWWADAGGWYVGDDPTYGVHVVVSDKSAEVSLPFGPSGPSLPADPIGFETTYLIATSLPSTYQAAHYCHGFSSGMPGNSADLPGALGVSNWFLPSELILTVAGLASASLPSGQRLADGTYWTSAHDESGEFYSVTFDAQGEAAGSAAPATTTSLRVRPVRFVMPAEWSRVFLSQADPFSLSGTFASNMDGWSGAFARTTTTGAVRTSPGGLQTPASAIGEPGDYVEFILPRDSVRGLRVTFKYWHRRASGTTGTYRTHGSISGQVETLPGSAEISTTTWQQFAAYRDFPGGYVSDVQVRIESARTGSIRQYFDDWEITGTPIP